MGSNGISWPVVGAYALGLAGLVGGALVARYVNPETGATVATAAGWWIGKLQNQFTFASTAAKGAIPSQEQK